MNRRWLGVVLGVTLLAAAPATAFAAPPNAPNGHASCVGTLSVFNQAHPEEEGTRSDIAHLFIGEARAEGIPPGVIYTEVAHVHGTVEQCL